MKKERKGLRLIDCGGGALLHGFEKLSIAQAAQFSPCFEIRDALHKCHRKALRSFADTIHEHESRVLNVCTQISLLKKKFDKTTQAIETACRAGTPNRTRISSLIQTMQQHEGQLFECREQLPFLNGFMQKELKALEAEVSPPTELRAAVRFEIERFRVIFEATYKAAQETVCLLQLKF